MNPRIKKIHGLLKEKKLDAFFVSSAHNISYLTESISRDSFLLVSKDGCVYFTDSRYTAEARGVLGRSFKIEKIVDSIFRSLALACKRENLTNIGFEEAHLSYAAFKKMRKELPESLRLVPTRDLVETLRQKKNANELARIKKAVGITVAAFRYAEKILKPGIRELEVAAEVERFIRYQGALCAAFDIIVASGPNSSYPHHITSHRKLRNNEPVLIDMGVDYEGYKSDLTRTFFLGRITPLYRRVYAIVLQANQLAIESLKIRARASEIDNVARGFIAGHGFGEFFGHTLGHGVGLEVHEAPRISGKDSAPLTSGMVFTIEPGIYLPGKFGVRIEDMIFLTEKGVEIPSGSLDK
ncbi:MAG: aminopeptidase P family protein [Candidatus Omnitrophica bacterium]|nr:aminopeptidase P family protein [Candidatus Omnitrophota bacterium]